MKSISIRMDDLLDRYFQWIVLAVALIGYGWYKQKQDDKTKSDFTNNLFGSGSGTGNTTKQFAAKAAARLYNAMFPSGSATLSSWVGDGTDEQAIFQIFREMKIRACPFSEVVGFYNSVYKRDLTADLQDELSYEDFNKLTL